MAEETHHCSALTPDYSSPCENCGQTPVVPSLGLCGPCAFGEADTVNGNWCDEVLGSAKDCEHCRGVEA